MGRVIRLDDIGLADPQKFPCEVEKPIAILIHRLNEIFFNQIQYVVAR
jgi:hypothetical protein